MKKSIILTPVMMAALLFTACSSDTDSALLSGPATAQHTISFTLRTPVGENIAYGRAIHEADEYAINSLTLYEYVVNDDGTSSLCRIMKKDGSGRNNLELKSGENQNYTFSIIVPADNDGKKYSYKFVANDATADLAIGSDFDTEFAPMTAKLKLNDDITTADFFAAEETGIAMTGVAKLNGNEIITMEPNIKCEVSLTRIVSRIDIRYATPNLKLTKVELTGAPESTTLFAAEALPVLTDEMTFHTLGLNKNVELLPTFLNETEGYTTGTVCEHKKAFYLYERRNTETNHIKVHIEYAVKANGREDYVGSIDVPFRKTGDNAEFVDAVRNHRYTIVLGNGTDPVSGKITAQILVEDWNLIEIEEPITD